MKDTVAETCSRVWGREIFFAANISDDPFLVIDQVFRIFPLFSLIFRIFTLLDVVHSPFLTRKTPFLNSFHTFAHIRQHYFSKYWGDECMVRPPTSNFGGTVPPRFPPLVHILSITHHNFIVSAFKTKHVEKSIWKIGL